MIANGSVVKVHYRGTLDDGEVFDSSYDRGEPIEFTIGARQMIPGFEAAVTQMEIGEKQTVHLTQYQAYGEYSEDRIERVPAEQIQGSDQMPIGEPFLVTTPDGQMLRVKVLKIEDGIVYLDLNHELAGKDLNFDLEVVDITPPKPGK